MYIFWRVLPLGPASTILSACLAPRGRALQGPQFRVLGAALWGPLCCLVHMLNDALRPRLVMEDILIGEGLLDPSIRGERDAMQADPVMRFLLPLGMTCTAPSLYKCSFSVHDVISLTITPMQCSCDPQDHL